MLHVARREMPEHVDAVWASQVCMQESIARPRAKIPHRLLYTDSRVSKARQIISWYPGVPFFIAHPQGLFKDRPVIQRIPRYTVDDCQYKVERWPQLYRKRTNLWSNCAFHPRPLCDKNTRECCQHGKHTAWAHTWYAIAEAHACGTAQHQSYTPYPPVWPKLSTNV